LSAKKQYPLIDYTSRDFNSIRDDLIDYAKRYYPNTFQDFSESGFGSLMVDTTAYIGDILSFYLDYSVNESFLDTAIEYENIIKLGRQMGYKFQPNASSYGEATFYIIIPASTTQAGPDSNYIPRLRRGTSLTSVDGVGFSLNEDINFANPNNEIVVANVNNATGVPTSFAIRAKGQVVSGRVDRQITTIGKYQKFLKIRLANDNITEIISVVDTNGNEYYEVDFLSQDTIYKATLNQGDNKDVTQNVLRPFIVPRRFVTERTETDVFLQFGYGSEITNQTVDSIIDPSTVIMKVHGKDYVSDVTIDPTNFLKTDKFGVAPANTTLTVIYRINDAENTNISANSLTTVDTPNWDFENLSSLSSDSLSTVINSLEVTNEEPITGDVTLPSVEELKTRIYNVFSSQNRAVTSQDYKSLCYSMPPQFGALKRVNIVRDPSSFKRNLNIYVISENIDGTLIAANSAIKQNLKQWLNKSRMISDTIDILDAKIVNLGIEFTAISTMEASKFDVLNDAILQLSSYYDRKYEIGEPFYITDIFNQLNKMENIIDVTSVKIVQKEGANYSNELIDVDKSFSADGRYVDAPKNVIFEIKYPDIDIKGTIK
tara:strand:+ start:765 stop:2567 length:1803 start_codon:yes stop_codon:yes gene_type:complete